MPWLKIFSLISLDKWIPHTEITEAKAECQSATLSASNVFTEIPLLGARGERQNYGSIRRFIEAPNWKGHFKSFGGISYPEEEAP